MTWSVIDIPPKALHETAVVKYKLLIYKVHTDEQTNPRRKCILECPNVPACGRIAELGRSSPRTAVAAGACNLWRGRREREEERVREIVRSLPIIRIDRKIG